MPPGEFEPTISAGERPKTYALDSAATGTGSENIYQLEFQENLLKVYGLHGIVNL